MKGLPRLLSRGASGSMPRIWITGHFHTQSPAPRWSVDCTGLSPTSRKYAQNWRGILTSTLQSSAMGEHCNWGCRSSRRTCRMLTAIGTHCTTAWLFARYLDGRLEVDRWGDVSIDTSDEHQLEGGNTDPVVRVEDTVRRVRQSWSPRVRELLLQLRAAGFDGAPYPLGTDERGRDVFTYLPGDVGHYPWTSAVANDAALISAAELLRRFHDATVEVAATWREGWRWPAREPVEVICHNDFAPYNCVYVGDQVQGVIDFDTAGPGPRSWDLAYALYRFAPLTIGRDNGEASSPESQGSRARLFLDHYGADQQLRSDSVNQTVPRLTALTNFMRRAADAGDESFARHIAEGHLDLYFADIDYITSYKALWMDLVAGQRRR